MSHNSGSVASKAETLACYETNGQPNPSLYRKTLSQTSRRTLGICDNLPISKLKSNVIFCVACSNKNLNLFSRPRTNTGLLNLYNKFINNINKFINNIKFQGLPM